MNIQAIIAAVAPLFSYPLNITIQHADRPDAEFMICCHGYGGSATHAKRLAGAPHHILSFDFPDAKRKGATPTNPHETSFGTIQELLPLLALIKACVVDAQAPVIHLYGFSAGGGAVINTLGVLNTDQYDNALSAIGITLSHKRIMLRALQQGRIILDCPLKSLEEIIALRGITEELEIIAHRYTINDLRPIDSIKKLAGLSLSILLYIQNPDEILSNRDDHIFYETLQSTLNKESTIVRIQVDDGGHNGYHPRLWEDYQQTLNL